MTWEFGVFARFVAVLALDVRPLVCGRLKVEGEFDRVDDGLVEDAVGLLSFLTDRGSFEAEPDTEPLELGGRRAPVLRASGRADLDAGTSLCDLE